MNLPLQLAMLEEHDDVHEARILILLDAFASSNDGAVRGLTKLAKLDFLLRYPVLLEKALKAKGRSIKSVATLAHERDSVESKMVRYRFGPWDHRYRRFINTLVARNLAEVSTEGRTVVISITDQGRSTVDRLSSTGDFDDICKRAKIIHSNFDLGATRLMKFIYETFPELSSLKSNSLIDNEI